MPKKKKKKGLNSCLVVTQSTQKELIRNVPENFSFELFERKRLSAVCLLVHICAPVSDKVTFTPPGGSQRFHFI